MMEASRSFHQLYVDDAFAERHRPRLSNHKLTEITFHSPRENDARYHELQTPEYSRATNLFTFMTLSLASQLSSTVHRYLKPSPPRNDLPCLSPCVTEVILSHLWLQIRNSSGDDIASQDCVESRLYNLN